MHTNFMKTDLGSLRITAPVQDRPRANQRATIIYLRIAWQKGPNTSYLAASTVRRRHPTVAGLTVDPIHSMYGIYAYIDP